jgi:hypothetical protein
MIHFARWDAVRELRDRKGEDGIPKTWEDAYELASEYFEGSEAAGSARTMKESYQLVRRHLNEGSGGRYYVPSTKWAKNFS